MCLYFDGSVVYFRGARDFDVAVKTQPQLPEAHENLRNIIRIFTRVCWEFYDCYLGHKKKIAVKPIDNNILRCLLVLFTACS